MSNGSMRTVITAVSANAIVTAAKFFGFMFSGSSALLAEAVHSLADTANQCLLYVGLRRSKKRADEHHHFGYGQERYLWNLISAVTIFFIGCLYTVTHAAERLYAGHKPHISWLAFSIVLLAVIVEGYSFWVAVGEFNRQRHATGHGFKEYFLATRDPTTLAVLIEDSVAMLGLFLALAGMGLSAGTGYGLFDGLAAILIGLLMGLLAVFLARMNRKYLVNHADTSLDEIVRRVWSRDNRVQRVHRINSIVLSPEESVLMAEVELREEAMFIDMSAQEIEQAIRFMSRLNEIRRDLEKDIRDDYANAREIFVELTAPQDQRSV